MNKPTNIVFNESWETGLKRYADKYFDLAICDIPYGIDVANMAYLKEKNHTVKQKNGSRLNPRKNMVSHTLKDWDKTTPDQGYYDELCRVSKNQIIFGVEYVDWKGLGPGRIKWIKGVADGMSFKGYEMLYCSLIDNQIELPLLWSGMMQAKSLNEPMEQQGNKRLNEKRIHPTQKPRLLYKRLLLDYAIKGMKILDTHNGSGSLRIESDLFGCDFVGFEIDKEYFDLQEARYNDFKRQCRLIF